MKNLFSYEGKRCLITGCFSGMGEATARVVQSLGGSVVAVDIKRPTTFELEAFYEVDLRDAAAIEQMVATVAAGGPIDRVFYCAGLPGKLDKLDVMLVNWVGLRHTIETCVPHMPRDGAVVSISSAAGMGHMGQLETITPLLDTSGHAEAKKWVEENRDQPWLMAYPFSKSCTILYTMRRAATLTTETGIRLNCTSPGPTDTPMMPAFVEEAGKGFMDSYPKPVGRNSSNANPVPPPAF